ncbi:hypothetical protein BH09VER1_BH09VER1_00270 [soil metagenome]
MLFSIVTPSYRQLDWLGLCVASVRDQAGVSGIEVEHIIQDAGSPGIEEFAREAGATLYRDGGVAIPSLSTREGYSLTIHAEADAGMYDAINRGLKRGTGTLQAYLNCDEQYLPGTLAKVAEFFGREPKTEMLFGDVILVSETGEALGYRRVTRPTELHTRLVHLGTLSCATFFRRRIIEEGHLFDPTWKAIGDAVWVAGILRAGRPISLLREPLGTFTFTGHNLSESNKGPDGEHARWARTQGAPPAWLKIPSVFHHRVTKLLGGAYRKRDLAYEIYRLRDTTARHRFEARQLGHSWPSPSTMPTAPK